MFDLSWGEILLIGIVALVAIGPKELPGVLRTLGQWTAKLRRMASEFQSQFQEAMREAEMADLKKQVDELTTQAKGYANFDPVGEVRREFESTQHQIEHAMTEKSALDAPGSVPGAEAVAAPVSDHAPPPDHAGAGRDVATAPAPTPLSAEPKPHDAGGSPA
jgi:sec-independent protein translocase protein TatB